MSAATVPARACAVAASGPVEGIVAAPASKSVTNRLLVVAALAEGQSVLRRPLASDDSTVMRRAVTLLGADVTGGSDAWVVSGTAGRLSSPAEPLQAGLSGTAMRFLTAVATLTPGGATVNADPPARRRPVGPLVEALGRLGAVVHDHGGCPPIRASGGGLDGGAATVDATASTQFASALLLVAPYARNDVRLSVDNPGAVGYVDLTAALMREWGAQVEHDDPTTWRVRAGRGYSGGEGVVESDASAAAHLLALGVATGGTVGVSNLEPATAQPDVGILDVYAAMGATVSRDGAAVRVSGPERPAAVDVDLGAMPDQVTTVAALAALADGPSTLTGVAVTRRHETDRIAALATELRKLGVAVDEHEDGLTVHGGRAAGPARLATHDDHRLAMAFAALAARIGDVVIDEPWCVTKTYPGFWTDVARLGVHWYEVEA